MKDGIVDHVAFPNVTTNQGPPALYMLGKAIGKDTPDLSGAIEAVGEKKDDIVTFYVKSSQLVQLMQQEEIWAAHRPLLTGALYQARSAACTGNAKEGQTGGMNVLVVPKGTKNEDLALQFMDFWLSTDVQKALAEKLVDSPTNKEVKVSDEVANNITYGDETAKACSSFLPP